jgi:hypothetical protein
MGMKRHFRAHFYHKLGFFALITYFFIGSMSGVINVATLFCQRLPDMAEREAERLEYG